MIKKKREKINKEKDIKLSSGVKLSPDNQNEGATPNTSRHLQDDGVHEGGESGPAVYLGLEGSLGGQAGQDVGEAARRMDE